MLHWFVCYCVAIIVDYVIVIVVPLVIVVDVHADDYDDKYAMDDVERIYLDVY